MSLKVMIRNRPITVSIRDINKQDDRGFTLLMAACTDFTTSNSIEILIKAGCNLNLRNNDGCTALMYACRYGKDVRLLIDAGCDINMVNSNGENALIYLCKHNDKPNCEGIVKILICAGININWQDVMGKSALMWACVQEKPKIVRMLIDYCCDLNLQDREGSTVLILLCEQDYEPYEEIIRMLVSAGCNLDIQDSSGNTALKLACAVGDEKVAKLLVDKGCRLDIVDSSGNTVLMYAQKNNDGGKMRNIIRLLSGGEIDMSQYKGKLNKKVRELDEIVDKCIGDPLCQPLEKKKYQRVQKKVIEINKILYD